MLAYLFVLVAIAIRFLPHPWAFTPVAASLLFFGAHGSRRKIWVPLLLLAASDLALYKYVWAYPMAWDQYVTWAWYAAILWLGTRLTEKQTPLRVIGAALASSVSFFVISNFAVWAAMDMYPKTVSGLMTCYALGLPYFRRGAEGDMLFTLIFFAAPFAINAVGNAFDKGSSGQAAA